MMKIYPLPAILILMLLTLSGCASQTGKGEYTRIDAEQAKDLMNKEADVRILDVRTAEEYAAGHIPGAENLCLDDIPEQAEQVIPEKGQLLLVYCRSGFRSKKAAEALLSLGYTRVIDFGGIQSWPYEIEK